MKNVILICIFLFGTNCFSQSYKESYNDYLNRYEYHDGRNNLIGYKTYNSFLNQWEYYEVKDQNNSYKYRNTQNINSINQVLASKQDKYDYNRKEIQDHINYLFELIQNGYKNEKQKKIAWNLMKQKLSEFNEVNNKIDYSSTKNKVAVKNYFTELYNYVRDHVDDYNYPNH